MKFVTNRCVQCGTPKRPDNLRSRHNGWLDATGTFIGTEFWFCCDDHYQEAAEHYVPREWLWSRNYSDTPEFKEVFDAHFDEDNYDQEKINRALRRAADIWHAKQRGVYDDAYSKLAERLRAEYEHQQSEQKEKQRIAEEKERVAREKEEAKLEEERLAQEEVEERLKPRDIPPHIRFEHTHILGPQGSGKTTLLQHIFLEDLKLKNPPAYIIIDPKGLLVERIAHLQVFHHNEGRLRDRLVVIDPQDAPALNMFRIRTDHFTKDQKASFINQLIELFGYIFSTAQSRLTQRQSIPFGFVLRLVFWMGGDINTLMDILEDDAKTRKFAPQIDQFTAQDETGASARFFKNDFYSEGFKATREQIRTRLYEITGRPELARMFLAKANKLDLFDCIQKRKIVLVNTGLSYLSTSGSQIIGRYIIAMAMNAVLSRYFIPQNQWNPVHLMIDEFQDFADEENTPKLLRLVREYKMGVVMAHQAMHCIELNEATRTSISTSAIKYAASPEANDLSYMGRDLRCDPAFLRQQQMRDGVAHFACYVRGMNLDHPFSIRISPKNIEREPQMTEDWYQSTRGWNSCNVCYQEAINENWTEEEWDEYERMQSPLEASSRPVTEATGVAPIITHEGPTKAEPSARPHAQSPRRSAHTESLPPQDTDENKPAPWKRG